MLISRTVRMEIFKCLLEVIIGIIICCVILHMLPCMITMVIMSNILCLVCLPMVGTITTLIVSITIWKRGIPY